MLPVRQHAGLRVFDREVGVAATSIGGVEWTLVGVTEALRCEEVGDDDFGLGSHELAPTRSVDQIVIEERLGHFYTSGSDEQVRKAFGRGGMLRTGIAPKFAGVPLE